MDKSQIESTINEIHKRSGAITALIMLFTIISISIPSTIAFAQEDNETQPSSDEFTKRFNELNIFHILIEIGLAFLIPFIYSKIQKHRKKISVIKIWKSKKDAVESITLSTLNNGSSTLKQIAFELTKMENQVAESFNEIDYLEYAGRMQYLKELVDSTSPRVYVLDWLKKYLNELVLSN